MTWGDLGDLSSVIPKGHQGRKIGRMGDMMTGTRLRLMGSDYRDTGGFGTPSSAPSRKIEFLGWRGQSKNSISSLKKVAVLALMALKDGFEQISGGNVQHR